MGASGFCRTMRNASPDLPGSVCSTGDYPAPLQIEQGGHEIVVIDSLIDQRTGHRCGQIAWRLAPHSGRRIGMRIATLQIPESEQKNRSEAENGQSGHQQEKSNGVPGLIGRRRVDLQQANDDRNRIHGGHL